MPYLSRIKVLIITLMFVAFPLAAHHSSAMYDREKNLRMQGTVVGLKWANPHVYLEAKTVGQSGQPEMWLVEGLPPAGMRSGGWTRDSLVPGEEIVIIGNPARKSGVRKILGQSVIKADGTILRKRFKAAGASWEERVTDDDSLEVVAPGFILRMVILESQVSDHADATIFEIQPYAKPRR